MDGLFVLPKNFQPFRNFDRKLYLMTYAAKSILWIVGGPITSVVFGYAAFMVFAFLMGAGFDIDDLGTPTQKFFGSLALPALGIIALGGTIFSLVMGIRLAIAHRAFVAEGYPKQTEQLENQPGEQVARGNRR